MKVSAGFVLQVLARSSISADKDPPRSKHPRRFDDRGQARLRAARQGKQMTMMAPIRPAVRRPLRVRLSAAPVAAGEARALVRAAIADWDVAVDPTVAELLTSEIVTNAIRHEITETIRLHITCSCGHLRVYVHDSCRSAPMPIDAAADAEAGRGLLLVSILSTDWGWFRTPTGKAVYFTLALEKDEEAERVLRCEGRAPRAVRPARSAHNGRGR
jgi:anti-sigma regulatory factor (Ser/Thr protein kinase)